MHLSTLTCRSQSICGVSTYRSQCLQKPTHAVNNLFSSLSTYSVVRTRLLLLALPRILFLLCNPPLDNLASNSLHQHSNPINNTMTETDICPSCGVSHLPASSDDQSLPSTPATKRTSNGSLENSPDGDALSNKRQKTTEQIAAKRVIE
jgi:hypothetical protein